VNGILYAVGGYDLHTAYPTATVEAFDPAMNSWTARGPMPTPRALFGVGVVNGIVYVVGGGGGLTTVEAYDPSQEH